MSILTPSAVPVPVIYVSHLPSASSYYASLTQPIGIQFLSHANVTPACLNFGYISQTSSGPRKTVVFAVTESATPSLSHLTLSAPSEKAVRDFHAQSWGLNPEVKRGENTLEKVGDEERAVTRDFDGNMIETVYSPRSRGGQRAAPAPVVEIETASTEKEARRVLEWQEKVARSVTDTERANSTKSEAGAGIKSGGPPTMKRADSYPLPVRDTPRLVRRETVTTTEHYRSAPVVTAEKKETSSTGNAILGSLLGVAAVAGFAAYALARPASPEPVPVARRGSGGGSHHTHGGPIEIIDRERVVERTAIPARSYVSERGHDFERERVQPSYVDYTVSSTHSTQSANRERDLARIEERSYHSSRAPSKVDTSSRYEREREPQRPRTIVPDPTPEHVHAHVPLSTPLRELIIEERDTSPSRESHISKRSHKSHRSHKSSTSRSPRNPDERDRERGDRERGDRERGDRERGDRDREREEKRYVEDRDERESSYTSARSHHTVSTAKPPPVPIPPPAASLVSVASTVRASETGSGRQRRRKSSHMHSTSNPNPNEYSSSPTQHSHYSGSPTHNNNYSSSPRHVPLPESVFSERSRSGTGASRVPLPESVAGHSEWERGSVRMVAGLGREYNEYRGGGLSGLAGLGGETDGYGSGGGGGGYAASVAPSDSISSVGVKRERDRLRDRMRMRDGHGGVVGGGW